MGSTRILDVGAQVIAVIAICRAKDRLWFDDAGVLAARRLQDRAGQREIKHKMRQHVLVSNQGVRVASPSACTCRVFGPAGC